MNKKAVSAVCVILIIAAAFCFVYIFANSKETDKQKEQDVEIAIENNQVNQREERATNIILTSRVGQKLADLSKFSNIYSIQIVEELDKYGIDNKNKILIALDKIFRKPDYQGFIGYSESYSSTYILESDLKKVVEDTFAESNIIHQEIEETLGYDEATQAYILFPRGYETGTIGFVVEVPYKITEYSNRTELLAYRVYVTQKVEQAIEEDVLTAKVEFDMFYDKDKTKVAYQTTDERMSMENNQSGVILEKINSGEIDKKQLIEVKYTFKKDEASQYKLSSFENLTDKGIVEEEYDGEDEE